MQFYAVLSFCDLIQNFEFLGLFVKVVRFEKFQIHLRHSEDLNRAKLVKICKTLCLR